MFIDLPKCYGDHAPFATPAPGVKATRRCGNYFEYCDGCCNSCEKCNYEASDHTTLTYQTATDSTTPTFQAFSTTHYQQQFLINKMNNN